jgi:hypothetical protein
MNNKQINKQALLCTVFFLITISQLFKKFSVCTELHDKKLAPLDLILSYLNSGHAHLNIVFQTFVYVDQS